MYKVKALINFTDYLGEATIEKNKHIDRKAGDIFEVTKERFNCLNGNNEKKIKAVELIEIIVTKAEDTKIEEVKPAQLKNISDIKPRKTTKQKREKKD